MNNQFKTCANCIFEKDCNLNTEACERFKDTALFNTKEINNEG